MLVAALTKAVIESYFGSEKGGSVKPERMAFAAWPTAPANCHVLLKLQDLGLSPFPHYLRFAGYRHGRSNVSNPQHMLLDG